MSGTPEALLPPYSAHIVQEAKKLSKVLQGGIDLTAGALGGAAGVFAGQSLDTVKVKQQAFPEKYPSMLRCFLQTWRLDGIRGLYAGTVPALAANIAENSVLFLFYGLCQRGVAGLVGNKDYSRLTEFENACAGGSAAFFSSLALCPTELIKCKLQAMREVAQAKNKPMEFSGPVQLTKHVFKTEGIQGFYRGFVGTLVREMPGYFVFFYGYEFARNRLTREGERKEDIGPFRLAICGGFAGVCLWTVIFPSDVVKSRSQLAEGATMPFTKTLKDIYKKEGIRALYKGLLPTIVRTIPATGCFFVTYEYSRKWMMQLGGESV